MNMQDVLAYLYQWRDAEIARPLREYRKALDRAIDAKERKRAHVIWREMVTFAHGFDRALELLQQYAKQ